MLLGPTQGSNNYNYGGKSIKYNGPDTFQELTTTRFSRAKSTARACNANFDACVDAKGFYRAITYHNSY